MKKIAFIMVALISTGIFMETNAQVCTPPQATGSPGLSPTWDSLPCIVRNQPYTATIELENFTSVGGISISSLRVDSIGTNPNAITGPYYYNGIPAGITYTTNKGDAPVTFAPGETGCVVISGTTTAPAGNYRLGIWVTVNVSGIGPVSGEAGNLVQQLAPTSGYNFTFYLRVVENASECPTDSALVYVGVPELTANPINALKIVPNPFTSEAQISLSSMESGVYTGILYDVVGKEVKREDLNVVTGMNSFSLERGNLNKGVYFYTITNGKQSASTRFVIKD